MRSHSYILSKEKIQISFLVLFLSFYLSITGRDTQALVSSSSLFLIFFLLIAFLSVWGSGWEPEAENIVVRLYTYRMRGKAFVWECVSVKNTTKKGNELRIVARVRQTCGIIWKVYEREAGVSEPFHWRIGGENSNVIFPSSYYCHCHHRQESFLLDLFFEMIMIMWYDRNCEMLWMYIFSWENIRMHYLLTYVCIYSFARKENLVLCATIPSFSVFQWYLQSHIAIAIWI